MAANESTILVPICLVEPEERPLTVYGLSESLDCRDEKTED